jgi:hypothetical protein
MHQQVHVVVLAVELAPFGAHARAHIAHDPFAEGEHGVVENVAPVLGDEDQMHVQVVDDASAPAYLRLRRPPR